MNILGNISNKVPYTAFYAKEEYINNNKDIITKGKTSNSFLLNLAFGFKPPYFPTML